jgi:hypothetical protein
LTPGEERFPIARYKLVERCFVSRLSAHRVDEPRIRPTRPGVVTTEGNTWSRDISESGLVLNLHETQPVRSADHRWVCQRQQRHRDIHDYEYVAAEATESVTS